MQKIESIEWPILNIPPVVFKKDHYLEQSFKRISEIKSFSKKLLFFDENIGRVLFTGDPYFSDPNSNNILSQFYDSKNEVQKNTYTKFRKRKFKELNEQLINVSFNKKINTIFKYDRIINLDLYEIIYDRKLDIGIKINPVKPSEILTFNRVIRTLLLKANKGNYRFNYYKNRFIQTKELIDNITSKIDSGIPYSHEIELYKNQRDVISKKFNYPNDYFTERQSIILANYFEPYENNVDMSDLFNYLLGLKEIDYSSCPIAVNEHIKIIHTENIVQFYLFLINKISQKDNRNEFIDFPNSLPKKEITHAAIALFYFFTSKYEGTAGITITNSTHIASQYGFNRPTSGKQLYEEFKKMRKDNERLRIVPDNAVAFNAHLLRYKVILPLLKCGYPKAHTAALKELTDLEKKIK